MVLVLSEKCGPESIVLRRNNGVINNDHIVVSNVGNPVHNHNTFAGTNSLNGGNQSNDNCDKGVKLVDINSYSDDKFIANLLSKSVATRVTTNVHLQCHDFKQWKSQTDFDFGSIPLTDLVLPESKEAGPGFESPIDQHNVVKDFRIPSFLCAGLPVKSQLNIPVWEDWLQDYWDKQLIELLRHGFLLDFKRKSDLSHDLKNCSSVNNFPSDIEAYIAEEHSYGAILGPFDTNPINQCHHSPFMTREKTGSDHRRVSLDLSWPKAQSLNAGIDKSSSLNSEFALQLPTVDHFISELKHVKATLPVKTSWTCTL